MKLDEIGWETRSSSHVRGLWKTTKTATTQLINMSKAFIFTVKLVEIYRTLYKNCINGMAPPPLKWNPITKTNFNEIRRITLSWHSYITLWKFVAGNNHTYIFPYFIYKSYTVYKSSTNRKMFIWDYNYPSPQIPNMWTSVSIAHSMRYIIEI